MINELKERLEADYTKLTAEKETILEKLHADLKSTMEQKVSCRKFSNELFLCQNLVK